MRNCLVSCQVPWTLFLDGHDKKVEHLTPPLPSRRSSRLENMAPVKYTEACGKKSHEKSDVVLIEELDGREELYTEEHEKLLGSCEVPWTLFVDMIRTTSVFMIHSRAKPVTNAGRRLWVVILAVANASL